MCLVCFYFSFQDLGNTFNVILTICSMYIWYNIICVWCFLCENFLNYWYHLFNVSWTLYIIIYYIYYIFLICVPQPQFILRSSNNVTII